MPVVLELRRWRQEDPKPHVILNYIKSLRLAWATCNPVSIKIKL